MPTVAPPPPTAFSDTVMLFGFQLTRTGLTPGVARPTRTEWEKLGEYLSWMHGAIDWLIGDWVAYGEAHFGEKAAQAIDATGWDLETVKQKTRVSLQVPPPQRDPALSWSHHREVADLPPAEQKKALTKAKTEDLSVAALRSHLRKTVQPVETCWLVVSCKNEKDRDRLQKRLEQEGRSCKIPG